MAIREKLKVFVSGKEGELDAERNAAIESINSLNYEPIASENRPASENPIEEELARELQSSEVYVGIFGKIYSKPTIDEFNLARKNKIPVLVFEKNLANESRDDLLEQFLASIKDSQEGITVSRYSGDLDLRDKITASLQTLLIRSYRESRKENAKTLVELIDDKMIPEISNSKHHVISAGIAFDKIKYPVGAIVYLRSFAPFLIVGEPLIFEVKNNDDVIFYQKIEAADCGKYEIAQGIYQTSFSLKSQLCQEGDSIIVKLRHGLAESYDSAEIHHHVPVIQTDKTYYKSNTDMILSIIDPDADKDSDRPDHAGDKEDSKIIIESSKGKFENYRLTETGDSTGIFMDVFDLVGINDKEKFDPKDGQIPVSQKDEVKITYSNSAGTAELSIFVTD